VIDADIQSFFDTIDHTKLRSVLDRRGVIRTLVDRWLNAGVLEQGRITRPDEGTPQGGVISPLLANILLHEVLDRWVERARRVMAVLHKRFERFGLKLHPEKTRLLSFDSPSLGTKRAQRERSSTSSESRTSGRDRGMAAGL
jgi:retron-type reverse transcriptase